ncbi:MAG: 1-acyl-sn-glycerol-3-phosphate acyltransferase [Gammaproteobacteria bacterium]|nr:1-acyl-sn-glycerol-3-phosphate acyltransferase [Gammaproteobacteria bacterium]MDD9896376.1 1-acyl-sn-glycerol-3-phosphate acyltransferase [Gammaproteobacteria bacterium]MDD9960448.1 1-acyl-sn-glycerol-3-phosphate acyltransferase [Gammaproteobacteria bacterium]
MDKFKDIRPYQDEEIRPVLDQLLEDEEMLDSIARFYYPRLTRIFPKIMLDAASKKLRDQVKTVHNVKSMQDVIAGYMDKMIHDTTTRLTNSGLEHLQDGRNYLFISNHRDITMDPAFVNYMLYHAGHETLQIAIGDNLLKKPFVTDLMRLNKSFIVHRSRKGRELLHSLKLLSEYMHFCVANGQNVWIAQREGRAKDGIDKTDPALLKMLAMARRDLPFRESLRELHIVPVTISYEYDACDILKADELYQIETRGSFTKTEESDIESIVTGMIGFKGHVHVAFGKELNIETDDPDELAEIIDTQILQNYELSDSNFLALEKLKQDGLAPLLLLGDIFQQREISNQNRKKFAKRLKAVDAKLHKHFLFGYANPVIGKLKSGFVV